MKWRVSVLCPVVALSCLCLFVASGVDGEIPMSTTLNPNQTSKQSEKWTTHFNILVKKVLNLNEFKKNSVVMQSVLLTLGLY